MSAGGNPPKKKSPVAYAEQDLKVHDVWKEALEAHERFNERTGEILAQSSLVRSLADQLEYEEAEFVSNARAEHSDMSQTAFEKFVKVEMRKDENLRDLRHKLQQETDRKEDAEGAAEVEKYKMRLLEARMKELAGLLQFYATARIDAQAAQAAQATRSTE